MPHAPAIPPNVGDQQATITRSPVQPQCVFAAGRQSFEVHVHVPGICSQKTKGLIFDELPLERNGWDFVKSRIALVRREQDYSVWRLSRASELATLAEPLSQRPRKGVQQQPGPGVS